VMLTIMPSHIQSGPPHGALRLAVQFAANGSDLLAPNCPKSVESTLFLTIDQGRAGCWVELLCAHVAAFTSYHDIAAAAGNGRQIAATRSSEGPYGSLVLDNEERGLPWTTLRLAMRQLRSRVGSHTIAKRGRPSRYFGS
jgi:hypothetical protein